MSVRLIGNMTFSGVTKIGPDLSVQSYQLTAATNGQAIPEIGYNISPASYLGGLWGSITPTGTSVNGNSLQSIHTTGSGGNYSFVVLLQATSLLPLTHFTGIEVVELGLNLSTSAATSHTWNNPDSLNDWTWSGLSLGDTFLNGQTYTVKIIL